MPCSCETKPEGCQCGDKCTCGSTHPKPAKQHSDDCTCGDDCKCGETCACEKK